MWAWLVSAIGAAAIVVLFPLALTRGVVDDPDRGLAAPTTTATAAPTTTAPPPRLQVLVIGDDLTVASSAGDDPSEWPELVQNKLRGSGYRVTVDVLASDGSGYTEAGVRGETFGQMAENASPGYDLVVFVGGANDSAGLQAAQEAAYEAYLAVWKVDGDSYMLVVGPLTSDVEPPPSVATTRQGVVAATQRAGIPFVDPLRVGWLTEEGEALVAADGRHLTKAGHLRIADRITPLIAEQLRQVLRDPSVTLGN